MKTIEIGLPCSPSKSLSVEEIKVQKVIVCYGSKTEVLYLKEVIIKDDEMEVIYFNGHERDINNSFVVSSEEIRVVKTVTDVTAHRNYNEKDPSKLVKDVVEIEYYEIKDSDKWIFSEKYVHKSGKKINLTE
jgi:hypothetical protein